MTIEPTLSDHEPIDDPPLDFNFRSSRPVKSPRQKQGDSKWLQYRQGTSRAVTIRLVFLVGLLAMVIWAMQHSGKAETWRWLYRSPAPNADSNGQPPDSQRIGTSQLAAPTIQIPSDDASAIEDSTNDETGALPDLTSALQPETVSDYELEFARRFLKSLRGHESFTFWHVVQSAVEQNELPVGETATAAILVNRLAQQWSAWNLKWDTMFAEGSVAPEQRSAVMDTRDRWELSVLPALAAVTIRPDSSLNKEHLLKFRQTVVRAADLLVEQYTHVGRPVESYSWFSAWSEVFDQPVSVERSELPTPTITQLLGQPEAWVGRTIAVEGTALRVQRVAAGKNPLDITEYFVIWIRPNHPSMYPFCIYSLLPPEKLMLAEREIERNQSVPISVAGRFFKIRLFDSDGKAGQAPLLMASTVEVLPDVNTASGSEPFGMPGAGFIATTLLLIGSIAGGAAWLAWRSSQSSKRRGQPTGKRLHSAMDNLQNDNRVESVREKIKRLETGKHE